MTVSERIGKEIAADVNVVIPPELVIALVTLLVQMIQQCQQTPQDALTWLRAEDVPRWRRFISRQNRETELRRACRLNWKGDPSFRYDVADAIVRRSKDMTPLEMVMLYSESKSAT